MGGSWVDLSASLISFVSNGELTGGRDNALAFGDSSDTAATVVITDNFGGFAWQRQRIRVTPEINSVGALSFHGIMVSRKRNSLDQTLTFTCVGFAALIRATKAYSPLVNRRSVATKTTAISVEDPANGAWRGGLINYILWQSGGRPLEQSGSYLTALFYYSCDQALIAPLWSWTAGENGWDECLKMAQAAGGQVYQGLDGVVRYEQPYGIADATSTYTFDEDVYGPSGVDETESTDALVTQVSCTYVNRQLRAMQQIVQETQSRIVASGETITIVVEPSWPVYALDLDAGGNLKAECFTVTYPWFGVPVLNTDYSAAFVALAQRITITWVNLSSYPLVLWGYVLKGQPVVAGPTGNVTVGSGTAQKAIADNPYIQTEHDARRLAKMVLQFYGTQRPVRNITGCVYDPARVVGEVVGLTSARLSLAASLHIVLKITIDESGVLAAYDLAYVGDLLSSSSYFQIGPTYSTSKLLVP